MKEEKQVRALTLAGRRATLSPVLLAHAAALRYDTGRADALNSL